MIADAKRIEKYEGIKYGFKSAIEQKCKIVIIDFNKYFDTSKPININATYRKLKGRYRDFENNIIKECYVVYGNKAIRITINNLNETDLIAILKAVQPK